MKPLTSALPDLQDYRPCVGICLFNSQGRVWLGRRYGKSGPHSWQFPQGGLDRGESAEFGALRELWEETGITIRHLAPLGSIQDWLIYDYPPGVAPHKSQRFKGQKQKWFAYRYSGGPADIDLRTHGTQEFSEWRWAKLSKTPDKVIPFKRDVYLRLASEFALFSNPVV
ncbi:MAG: RNA pyrophosphohydrolase [Litorimonas sp.]